MKKQYKRLQELAGIKEDSDFDPIEDKSDAHDYLTAIVDEAIGDDEFEIESDGFEGFYFTLLDGSDEAIKDLLTKPGNKENTAKAIELFGYKSIDDLVEGLIYFAEWVLSEVNVWPVRDWDGSTLWKNDEVNFDVLEYKYDFGSGRHR